MMSPGNTLEDRRSSQKSGHTSLQIIHFAGNFMRIWSIYSLYSYVNATSASAVFSLWICLAMASVVFLVLQKPWKGRPLSRVQVVLSVANGGITALYFISWGTGLKWCGPLRAILGEYSGAILGVLSALLYGRKGHIWKKVGGLVAIMASFYFLSQGWAMASYSPFSFKDSPDTDDETEEVISFTEMTVPIFAGILSALRRVIARRVSLKNQFRRRLNAITIATAACLLFPVALSDKLMASNSSSTGVLPFYTWPFISTTLFGVILIFYVDNVAEERLHIVFSSPRHLAAAAASIIFMEIIYKMDFALVGFLFCCLILGFGIYEATSVERGRKDSHDDSDISDSILEDQIQMSPLPT